MSIEKTENSPPEFSRLTADPSLRPAIGSIAPYRTFNQLLRGLIAAAIMVIWGVSLVGGIFLLRPDVSQSSGVIMVLAVPILLVSALPIVYRYWVKNWRTL